jgi:GNAT superfamily N-acetyltransferase
VIEIRLFETADAAAVAIAIVDSSIHHTALEPDRYRVLDPAIVAADYRAGLQHPTGQRAEEAATFVAATDGHVVGVVDIHVARPAGAHQPRTYGYIPELAVAADARRLGAGAALMAAAEDWARRHGCAYTVLDYNARNADAGRFYRDRLGYRPAGEIVIKDLLIDEAPLL